jgi:hypothetical protein
MATYLEILLRPLESRPVRSVVDEVADSVETSLSREPGYEDEAYVGIRDNVAIELFVDHGHEDDGDMPFATHPYMLRFRTLARDVDQARELMERAYSSLKNTGNYSLFSTYDLQYLIAADLKNS